MNVHSMTGFARASGEQGNTRYYWELRSVNGKGLDIRLRLPQGYEGLEQECRKAISSQLTRGNVQVVLAVEGADLAAMPSVNEAALDAALKAASTIAGRLGSSDKPTLDTLLSMRGVIEYPQSTLDADQQKSLHTAMIITLGEAVSALRDHRALEGQALRSVLNSCLDEIEVHAQAAKNDPSRNTDAIKKNLEEQVARLMEANSKLDAERLHTEVALLATKADIREELDRLDAHIVSGRELLTGGGAIGRKLDFLAQEFNRESNTICSKSNAISLTAIGLDLKAVVDQFREQIQNLE